MDRRCGQLFLSAVKKGKVEKAMTQADFASRRETLRQTISFLTAVNNVVSLPRNLRERAKNKTMYGKVGC